jgi:hypothetical protein
LPLIYIADMNGLVMEGQLREIMLRRGQRGWSLEY